MKKKDGILIGCCLLTGGILFAIQQLVFREEGAVAVVYVDKKEIGSYPLLEDTEVEIKGVSGGQVILVIRDNEAFVKEADCPDQICVKHSKVHKKGENIICLPNKVVIEIQDTEEGYDAVAE